MVKVLTFPHCPILTEMSPGWFHLITLSLKGGNLTFSLASKILSSSTNFKYINILYIHLYINSFLGLYLVYQELSISQTLVLT